MFYCKDVKYDMCELEKNHGKKNKICKEFDDLTFHWTQNLKFRSNLNQNEQLKDGIESCGGHGLYRNKNRDKKSKKDKQLHPQE